jgi:hypothetical protein
MVVCHLRIFDFWFDTSFTQKSVKSIEIRRNKVENCGDSQRSVSARVHGASLQSHIK